MNVDGSIYSGDDNKISAAKDDIRIYSGADLLSDVILKADDIFIWSSRD
jgi:hypothetical protein